MSPLFYSGRISSLTKYANQFKMLASVIVFIGLLNSLIIIKLLTACNQLPSIRHTRIQEQLLIY